MGGEGVHSSKGAGSRRRVTAVNLKPSRKLEVLTLAQRSQKPLFLITLKGQP